MRPAQRDPHSEDLAGELIFSARVKHSFFPTTILISAPSIELSQNGQRENSSLKLTLDTARDREGGWRSTEGPQPRDVGRDAAQRQGGTNCRSSQSTGMERLQEGACAWSRGAERYLRHLCQLGGGKWMRGWRLCGAVRVSVLLNEWSKLSRKEELNLLLLMRDSYRTAPTRASSRSSTSRVSRASSSLRARRQLLNLTRTQATWSC